MIMIGIPFDIVDSMNVSISIRIVNNSDPNDSFVIDDSVLPFESIEAGIYRPNDLILLIASLIKKYVFDCAIELGLNNLGSIEDKSISFDLPRNDEFNSLITFSIFDLGIEEYKIDSVELINENGLWSLLGFCREIEASVDMTISGEKARLMATYQTMNLFIFPHSINDTMDIITDKYREAHQKESGSIVNFSFGGFYRKRELSLNMMNEAQCGPDRVIGRSKSLSNNRSNIEVSSIDVSCIKGDYSPDSSDQLTLDKRILFVDGHYSRFDLVNGSFEMQFKAPPSVNATNKKIYSISDISYIYAKSRRYPIIIYEYDSYGNALFVGSSYSVVNKTLDISRDPILEMFDVKLELLSNENDGMVQL